MNDRLINILYIDDEVQNLQSFTASFRRDYNIFTTTSVKEAVAILQEKTIHVIFADQRMPAITGVQFFESIREKHPDPIRILVTGYTDITSAIDAINKGEVFRFISKPWGHEYVQNAIAQAFDIYQTRSDLRQRNLELQKAYEELGKFVYNASHDLRAPLMSILGVIQLSLVEENVNTQREYLHLIKQSVHKLDSFIIHVIDYYKNARGTLVMAEINFGELIAEAVDSIRFLPGFEKIDIQVNIDQTTSFYSDIFKLRTIFNNLLTNAVKFQDPKKTSHSITLTVAVSNEMCSIEIADNGIGIQEADIGKVFEMFFRGISPNPGSGIGLYIVREAVIKLGGELSVSSVYGECTIFKIALPSANI